MDTNASSLVTAMAATSNRAAPSLAVPKGDAAAAHKAAEDFASFFFSQSLESVYAGIPTDSMFGGGPGEGIYRSLMIQEYGKVLARTGNLGVTDTLQREILRLQEAA